MNCPLCQNDNADERVIYLNDLRKNAKLFSCRDCGLSYLSNLKISRNSVYGKNYSVWGADESNEQIVESSKKAHFRYLLLQLNKRVSFRNKTLLDVGTGKGYLLEVAKELGFKDVYGLELSKFAADIANKKFPGKIFCMQIGKLKTSKKFDVVVMTDLLEHLPSIKQDFENISRHVKRGGYIVITTPNTGSSTRLLLGKKWFQYKFEHVVYFNKKSMKYLLRDYDIIVLRNNVKLLQLGYYKLYLKKYSGLMLRNAIPSWLESMSFRNHFCGELLVIARKR